MREGRGGGEQTGGDNRAELVVQLQKRGQKTSKTPVAMVTAWCLL